MTRIKPNIGLASLLLCLCLASAEAQSLRTVVLTGDDAPGTLGGVTYAGFVGPPVLNSAGQTAFLGFLTGTGVESTNKDGIWSEGSGALGLVVREGTHAPGTLGDVNFREFVAPSLNSAGQSAFTGLLIGDDVAGTNSSGIWSEGSGALGLVARTGNQAPGTSAGVNFSSLNSPVLNSPGQTALRGNLTGNNVTSSNNSGIWSEGSGSLGLVARKGSQAPGTTSGANFSFFFAPVLNSAGHAAFFGFLTGNVDSTNNNGIWSDRTGTLDLVILAGSQAAGALGGVNFSSFGSPVQNSAGRTAFLANLTGIGVDVTNDQGIWSEGSGTLDLIARSGTQAPVVIGDVKFSKFDAPLLNAAGETAFHAELTGNNVDGTNDNGIWSEGSGSLDLVVREGDQAPGTPMGVDFSSFDTFNIVLNSAGQTAFKGTLTGSGIDNANDEGIWAEDRDGILRLIAREGDDLKVALGDIRTIVSLEFLGGTGNEDGRRSGLNDLGQIAFRASFTDSSAGIFVSNLVASPAVLGDFDEDGEVDGGDFLAWQRGGSPLPLSAADLANWKANFGTLTDPLTEPLTTIPEPATTLFMAILASLCVRFPGRVSNCATS